MSNTIGHRASTYSKFALNKQQSDGERAAKERRREDVTRLVNERNPQIAINKKREDEKVEKCRDALMNSYFVDFSKIFERVMLWPFVPGLKSGEAVTAGARLVLFCCMAFGMAVIASKKLSPKMAKSLELFNIEMDTRGIVLTSSILILPNILYYVIQKMRFKMCLNKAKKNSMDSQAMIMAAERNIEREVDDQYTSNYRQFEGTISSENLFREPIRQQSSLGGHPGVAGII